MEPNVKATISDEDVLNGTSSLSLHRASDNNREGGEVLVPVNSYGNVDNLNNSLADSQKSVSSLEDSAFSEHEASVQNNNASGGSATSPTADNGDPGTTSMKPKSKRPKPKPSAALLEAKRKALARLKNGESETPQEEVTIVMKDHLQPARDAKYMVRGSTGVVYDMRMVQHECPWDPNYPEKPERFSAVIKRCEELGLLDRCTKILPRMGTKEEVLLMHTQEHIDKLQSICETGNYEQIEEICSNYDAIYMNETTYNLSLLSVGCTIDLVDAVLKGTIQNGMAIIRPPGHHAMKAEYCGYCYFNNVAIAAKKALSSGKASKVLIVDFDVHHGQATQQMFYDDPRVLYFSTHRYEHGKFWPNLEESNSHFIGTGKGTGFNCNVPLNKSGLVNSDFLSVWHQLLIPMAYEFNPDLVIVSAGYDIMYGCFEFNPDLVLVSAGYDSLIGDEKGEMELTPQCCPHLLWPLLGLASGKVAVVLEGGYCIQSLAEGAALTLRALLGDPCPVIPKAIRPSPVLVDSVMNTTYMLRPIWKHLKAHRVCPDELTEGVADAKGLLFVPNVHYDWKEPKPEKYATRNCYPIQNDETVRAIREYLDKLILSTNLSPAENKVGIVYDEIMLKHRNMAEPGHPERPERISNIFSNHGNYGLLERCIRLKSRESKKEELLLLHTEDHIRKMMGTGTMAAREMNKFKDKFNSIYFNSSTYQAALVASGSVLEVVDNVMNSKCQSGIAIVRPPGHHAEEDYPHGFCIFNNVALAAKYAIENYDLKRVMIVDWDVHHGNGIQRMFESDPRVLYVSIHRYDNGTFFPCSEDANYNAVGKGPGAGFNVNIPWNSSKMGDTEYLAAFTNVVLPIGYEFCPELVLVSAGFDAARGDPLGGCKVTPEGYGHMTHLLSSLANGRVILALEGGYNLTSIAYSMVMCTKALLGDPLPPLTLNDDIHPGALHSIQNVLDVHAEFWASIEQYRKFLPHRSDRIPKGTYFVEKDREDAEQFNNVSSLEGKSDDSTCQVGSPAAEVMSIHLNPEDAGACGGVSPQNLVDLMSQVSLSSTFEEDAVAAVYPARWCPHLETSVKEILDILVDTQAPCLDCGSEKETWICLTCHKTLCGRFVNAHMRKHYDETNHNIVLSFADLSVWCYPCETYLENPILNPILDLVHLKKFGEARPKRN